MKNDKKVEKKSTPLYVRMLAGAMAEFLLAGTVFGMLYYFVLA